MHFGATLRLLRIDAGFGLRELARRVGVSGAYLSRVENGHDPVPTPERIAAIADALGVPRAILLEVGKQTSAAVSDYLTRVPAASAFMLEVARRNLGAVQLARLMTVMDREFPTTSNEESARSLASLLTPTRVVLQLSCHHIDDLLEVVAAKLLPGRVQAQRELVARLHDREQEGATAIGSGFLLPHATIVGVKPAAAIVTLARALRVPSPDEFPARIAIALVSNEPSSHLRMLARISRLAREELSTALLASRSPEEAIRAVRRVEAPW